MPAWATSRFWRAKVFRVSWRWWRSVSLIVLWGCSLGLARRELPDSSPSAKGRIGWSVSDVVATVKLGAEGRLDGVEDRVGRDYLVASASSDTAPYRAIS
jgi:hypothetical protein